MRCTEICRRELEFGDRTVKTVVYAVAADDLYNENGTFVCESYGAAVSILQTGERAVVRCMTQNSRRILGFIDSLARGLVTPVSLRDVAEDWLGRE